MNVSLSTDDMTDALTKTSATFLPLAAEEPAVKSFDKEDVTVALEPT